MAVPNPAEAVAVVNLDPKQQLADRYDIGDTDVSPDEDPHPLPARNPDGTFAKATPAAAEPTVPVTPAAPVETPKPTHSKRAVQMAQDYGIADEDIANSTPDQLDFAVYQAHRMQLRMNEERANERALLDSTRRREPEPKPAPVEPPDEAEALLGVLDREMDPDSALAKAIKLLVKENKALRKEMGGMKGRDEQRTVRAADEAIDDAFSAMGAPYEKVFGKGDFSQLDPKSSEARRRLIIWQHAGINTETDTPKVIRAKIKNASEAAYADLVIAQSVEPPVTAENSYEAAAAQAVAPKTNGKQVAAVDEWNKGATATPTQRTDKELPGRAKALRTAAAKLKEIPESAFDDDEEAGY